MYHRPKATGLHSPNGLKPLFVTVAESQHIFADTFNIQMENSHLYPPQKIPILYHIPKASNQCLASISYAMNEYYRSG